MGAWKTEPWSSQKSTKDTNRQNFGRSFCASLCFPVALTGYKEQTAFGRMLTLDAMRGVAAIVVVTYHALGVAPHTASIGWEWWLPQIAAYTVHFAYAGIYLFFVISGFCIHLYWAKARASGVDQPVINFRSFWKRRVRRLYPPYFAALALYLCYLAYKTPVQVQPFTCGTLCFTCSCCTTSTPELPTRSTAPSGRSRSKNNCILPIFSCSFFASVMVGP